jgi:lipid-binding SYLF domain-containing protein
MNRNLLTSALLGLALLTFGSIASADDYSDTIKLFKDAGESNGFFARSYGYAVFPNIAKGGMGIGGAYGKGKVYRGGAAVGKTSMTQLSVGFQLGGQGYSMIIFFEDKRAFDEFTKDGFEFGAQASAVAITAGATAGAGTTGTSAGASAGKKDASNVGEYYKGMATFVIIKGGAMYEAAIAGAKFNYKPL